MWPPTIPLSAIDIGVIQRAFGSFEVTASGLRTVTRSLAESQTNPT